MTFEERIDKLTDRHEALAPTVEILTDDIEKLAASSKQDGENIRTL